MLEKALYIATLGNRLVEALVAPIWKKFELDTFWLMPIAWVVCGVLGALAGLNLFADVFPDPLVGVILTAIAIGCGANFLHDFFDFFKKSKRG